MKIQKVLSLVFALLAVVLTALTLWVVGGAMDAAPALVTTPAAAVETADAVMAAVCAGDYEAAGEKMYGKPNLGTDRAPGDPVGQVLWNAFLDSLSYELVGDCYATDAGLAQDVTFTCLDFSSVTASLQSRAQELLVQRVADAEGSEDADTIYDEKGDYREDFVMEVLLEVTRDALKEDAKNKEQTLTLNLVYKQGSWWILADSALLGAISGGIVG